MNSQQLHDHVIKPTLEYMGGNYNSKNARFLLLCTAAIESQCGHYIKQVNGPALGIWQMEPATESDILLNCDAIQHPDGVGMIQSFGNEVSNVMWLTVCPMYACAMARLKYSMDREPLPDHNDVTAVYAYYKRIFNTPLGASTYKKFLSALANNHIMDVAL